MKLAAAPVVLGALATITAPADWWVKVLLEAPLVGLLWWLVAKTIPQISTDNRSAIERLSEELKSHSQRTNTLLEKALDRSWHDAEVDEE